MKRIHIFKTGTHTDSGGTTLEFDEGRLTGAAEAYDPSLHEAPIVIGHPKSNGPAYGWIKAIAFDEGNLYAEPHQVNPDFEEMVETGAFKKISASWYLPDSPANPKPGTLYLRHVGFLGAQPPAIKGLLPVEFNEDVEGVIEFEDAWQDGWNLQGISGVFKRLREFVIDKFSREEADRVIPDYVIDDLNRSAERKLNAPETNSLPSNYEENHDMTLEELKAENDRLKADLEATQGERDGLKTQVAEFEEAQQAAKQAQLEAKVDDLIAKGTITPAQRGQVLAFAQALEASGQTVEFGEGDNKESVTGADALLRFIGSGKAVNFNEQSQDQDAPPEPMDSRTLAAKAVEYQEEQRKAGRTIDIATAVNELNQKAE